MIKLLAFLLFFSCSLEYDVAVKKLEEQGIPDLVFEAAKLSRYTDEELSTKVDADILEFYGKEERIYGKNTKFTIYDENNEVSAEGSATLMDANQSTEIYSLLKGAEIASYTQGMRIKGQNFNWNNKTEQLVAGKDDEVTIEYGTLNNRDITLSVMGKGFAASSIGMDYRFTEKSAGTVNTDAQNSPPELPVSVPATSDNSSAINGGEPVGAMVGEGSSGDMPPLENVQPNVPAPNEAPTVMPGGEPHNIPVPDMPGPNLDRGETSLEITPEINPESRRGN